MSQFHAGASGPSRSEAGSDADDADPRPDRVAFSDLARAAYCPRQLYYARRERADDPDAAGLPERVRERVGLAFRYDDLRGADDATLAALPIDRPPHAYRAALDRLAARPDWDDLRAPARERVVLTGRDCRGVVHKLLDDPDDGGPPTPTYVSPGDPPERGVWTPQRVRAVAAAKALAWELEREVPAALVEYPAHGVVRRVRLTTRSRARYRRTLRTVRSLSGPPPRVDDDAKCAACDYRERCGVRSRSLRSLLGL